MRIQFLPAMALVLAFHLPLAGCSRPAVDGTDGVIHDPVRFSAIRFEENPIIYPEMDPSLGDNINGPSLIRVPDWVSDPLGKYYLYFADHHGKFIRMAYSDHLEGPWTVYTPGVLHLEETRCRSDLASPDVHVDDETQEMRMYFHCPVQGISSGQFTLSAGSDNGLVFRARPERLGTSYFRVFEWDGDYFAVANQGQLYRSGSPDTPFEQGRRLFRELPPGRIIRHVAVLVDSHMLLVFYTRTGDDPESILLSTVDLRDDWTRWTASPPQLILSPSLDYEGGGLPSEPSTIREAKNRVRQLRDPAIYVEGSHVYLLYAVAGEQGIAIAELIRDGAPAP